ncbi:uncharacterized protein LOC106013754 [Aplysia californica]|uniref:Uncharacterized protein LOC106013754 n=1 Tax=Aplysia californica TaxID=6500 RepID=A0ABM1ADT3_APLCA|nr:uncharacterized protein LOC106013754 [Aplysia californica]
MACGNLTYTEATPAWFHSYGLDYECRLRPSEQLRTRHEQILTSRLPEVPQLWEQLIQMEKIDPVEPRSRVVLDVRDSGHHAWPPQTQTESQSIGWFADSRRQHRCRLREWPASYSFC